MRDCEDGYSFVNLELLDRARESLPPEAAESLARTLVPLARDPESTANLLKVRQVRGAGPDPIHSITFDGGRGILAFRIYASACVISLVDFVWLDHS